MSIGTVTITVDERPEENYVHSKTITDYDGTIEWAIASCIEGVLPRPLCVIAELVRCLPNETDDINEKIEKATKQFYKAAQALLDAWESHDKEQP